MGAGQTHAPTRQAGGRRRTVEEREVLNGVMYVLTGCQWRYLPKDLPPKSTVHDDLTRWNYEGNSEMFFTEQPAPIAG